MPPVVHFLTPSNLQVDTTLKVYSSGFVTGTKVFIGKTECRGVHIIGQFLLSCEVVGSASPRCVTVHNGAFVSSNNNIVTV